MIKIQAVAWHVAQQQRGILLRQQHGLQPGAVLGVQRADDLVQVHRVGRADPVIAPGHARIKVHHLALQHRRFQPQPLAKDAVQAFHADLFDHRVGAQIVRERQHHQQRILVGQATGAQQP